MMVKTTKAEHARRLASIRAKVNGFYSSETREWLAFILDEQFNFIPISERLHNCLGSAGVRSLDDLRRYIEQHGAKSLLVVKNFGKGCLQEVEEVLAHRRAGAAPQQGEPCNATCW